MYLEGKVQTAQVNAFGDVEIVVIDRQVVKPAGGRPQYTCRLIRGWPGVEELRRAKSAANKGKATQQEVEELKVQITLPQEDQVLQLVVVDQTGKNGFTRFVCEVAGVA